MDKVTQAVSLFKDGFLCSQAILSSYSADLGLAQDTALKLSAGFGGGMAGKGQTCGAVSGAVMVLGLAKGHTAVEDKASKMAVYGAVSDFLSRFEKVHGTVNCNDLLDCDLGTAEGYAAAKEGKLFTTLCPEFVATAAKLLEQVLSEP